MKTKAVLLSTLLVAGCAYNIPKEEAFEAKPLAQHMQIRWVTVEDPNRACKRFGQMPIVGACAIWDFAKQTCMVITGRVTTGQVLGHEVRHCFEGDFHD
jgi:hypothetical protein